MNNTNLVSLKAKMKVMRNLQFSQGFGISFFSIISLIWLSIAYEITTNDNKPLIIFYLVFCFILILWATIVHISEKKRFKIIDNLIQEYEIVLSQGQSTEEILLLAQKIYNAIGVKSTFEHYESSDMAYGKNLGEKGAIWNLLIGLCTDMLWDLKNDLASNNQIQKDVVQTAQESLRQIPNNLATVQQARLDKQIEQFEELQRVLVKV